MPAKAASSAPPSSAAPPPWIELPGDVMANILQRLGTEEILRSAQTMCTTWWKVCRDPSLWRVVDLKNPHDAYDFEFHRMCRCAVDRSHGQLTDLSIDCFGDYHLLNYVVDRSSILRRLTVVNSCDISGIDLAEAVKKLPKLEELRLIMMPSVYSHGVKTIGVSCPMLKSFTLCEHADNQDYDSEDDDEDYCSNRYALAIGETMPNLRHLRLISNLIKNDGLEAILDGCPHLESLDLRLCFGLDLQGALGERCSKQIKDLRLPCDSIRDLEWPITKYQVGRENLPYLYEDSDCDDMDSECFLADVYHENRHLFLL